MKRYHINRKYKQLENEIRQIPNGNYQVERTFCNHRNTVQLVCIQGEKFVIKRYKRPTIANYFIYTFKNG